MENRPAVAAVVEAAADAVGVAFGLAERLVQAGGELAAQDLVEDGQVGVVGVVAGNAGVASAEDGLRSAWAIEQQEPGAQSRDGGFAAGYAEWRDVPLQPAVRESSRRATWSGSTSPATTQAA